MLNSNKTENNKKTLLRWGNYAENKGEWAEGWAPQGMGGPQL